MIHAGFAHMGSDMRSQIKFLETIYIFASMAYYNVLVHKCKVCGLQFEEEKRLQIHKKVHGRKPKISEYGSPEFSQDRLRG
ncbi:MAG: hypothetical protein WBX29_08485 [Nitrososphaeraceae archaeon]